jgi:transposase
MRPVPAVAGRARARSSSTQGVRSNYKDPPPEPDDHGLGRSRGGWTTKAHVAVDAKGRPLSIVLTAGQAADTTHLEAVLDGIAVPRPDGCGVRRNPDQVLADKGYSSKANRELLRARSIITTIPERADQLQNRQNRGSAGGRPYAFDRDAYKGRNVVERCFNRLKQWRAVATRYDKLARNYRAGVVLASIFIWLRS